MKLNNFVFGALLPLLFLAAGIGVFIGLKPPVPPRVEPLGDNIPRLLEVLPIAEIEKVRLLSELSETLNIPVSGSVVPYRELQLAAEVAGRIVEKDPGVQSGNYVSKGQLLYRIDPQDYQLSIERLQRRLQQEQASLAELDQEIQNGESILEVVQQQLDLAKQEVARLESLGEGVASLAELDATRRSQLSVMNQLVTSKNQLTSAKSRRSRLELAIKSAETELKQAELDLRRTQVVAPVSGRIVSEQVEVDSYVQRGTLLVVVEDTEKVEVAANLRMDELFWILDEQSVSAEEIINPAQASRYDLPETPVRVQFRAGNRENTVFEWQGVLDRYDGAGLDAQSRTVPIRIRVDQPSEFRELGSETQESSGPPMLVRGMFVEAIIEARPATPLLLVPKLSIKPATGSYQVWKFEKDPDAVYASRRAIRERLLAESEDENSEAATQPAPAQPDAASKDGELEKELPNPDEWDAGFLKVLDNIRVVSAFVSPEGESSIDGIEYSVCESDGTLQPQDLVITTPLPGIEGLGEDPVRVKRKPQQ